VLQLKAKQGFNRVLFGAHIFILYIYLPGVVGRLSMLGMLIVMRRGGTRQALVICCSGDEVTSVSLDFWLTAATERQSNTDGDGNGNGYGYGDWALGAGFFWWSAVPVTKIYVQLARCKMSEMRSQSVSDWESNFGAQQAKVRLRCRSRQTAMTVGAKN